jgi:hypothetical protein
MQSADGFLNVSKRELLFESESAAFKDERPFDNATAPVSSEPCHKKVLLFKTI